jgi:very-short-patch-repair endonuclease
VSTESEPSESDGTTHQEPLPPRGEGVGDGGAVSATQDHPPRANRRARRDSPTPNPSPQGGGESSDDLSSFNEKPLVVRQRKRSAGAIHTSQRGDRQAKRLRANATLPEERLWQVLRKLDLDGGHFRRQAPFGPYIVDFICHRARLIIEVDGGVHALPTVAARDAEREAWLRSRGYAVVRVTNEDALYEARRVAERIAEMLGDRTPQPDPGPLRLVE